MMTGDYKRCPRVVPNYLRTRNVRLAILGLLRLRETIRYRLSGESGSIPFPQVSATKSVCRPTSEMTSRSQIKTITRLALALTAVAALLSSCAATPPQTAAAAKPPTGNSDASAQQPLTRPPATYVANGERRRIGSCPVFPKNNVFHADIRSLPVAANSAATIKASGANSGVRPAFSAGVHQGSRNGMPINVVDSSKMHSTPVYSLLHGFNDLGSHPIPANPRIEGYPGIAWDQHMLLVDTATCSSHEFFLVRPPNVVTNFWWADSGLRLDLTSNKATEHSATASGFSLLAGMVRYDEVASGSVNHAVGFALPTISDRGPIWPATGSDGRSKDPNAPRMGAIFRLRSDVNLSKLGPTARMIAKAMQVHGAILSDTTPEGFAISGENDERWNDHDLATLTQLKISDFEVVNAAPMKVADGSYEIR